MIKRWRINLYDTSILPNDQVREAMIKAELGDDVYGEDPTVNELEREAAVLVKKEAALFVPSGTMGNLIALMVQSSRGDEVVLEEESHIYYYETGGLSTIAGLLPRLVRGDRGVLTPERIKTALRKPNIHYPRTSMLCIENTHNRAGGTITPPEIMEAIRELAIENGLRVHLDGARIFNAAVAMNVSVNEFTKHVDTVMFCLSKGLGAPVGSILAGSHLAIEEGRRVRKMLGGGMRKAGVLAAAGLVALRTGINLLARDHQLAKSLAKKLDALEGLRIDLEQVQTNMVLVDVGPSDLSADQMKQQLAIRGIRVSSRPPTTVRMVVHKQISPEDLEEVVETITEIIRR